MRMVRDVGRDCHVGRCDRCQTELTRWRGQGDFDCHKCGAIYNCFGQRLRDDLWTRRNPSEYSDDIGDMEGNEMSFHDS